MIWTKGKNTMKNDEKVKEDIVIRDIENKDESFILRENEINVKVLSPLDEEGIKKFKKWAHLFKIIEVNGRKAGFLIALDERANEYKSENYIWFSDRFPIFLYVDRIVISEKFRNMGLGMKLYDFIMKYAREKDIPVVAAEVDIIPYNEGSLRFHSRLGFKEIDTQYVRNGEVKVSLQIAEL